mmetsp:Transcript_60425/g.165968  ORF Transcript_60425/g.165968 Transcript_60425/m.165968 type:complete len:361 (-) Transcript_60425:191-1273(-)|eukprot:CAMPEP_0119479914 /NCGR_PEP_ID=MMETSP1344-20130328/8966_1 /TAXON_ID=236787 /ORGANISM="Florenciella parvula, Strain CCMP2471" /LENGTH=360 /DNA_ID=CAMNT_0007514189 /DNA_START=273 /DNA_END=1355 /DNA_ORIENTATION=-
MALKGVLLLAAAILLDFTSCDAGAVAATEQLGGLSRPRRWRGAVGGGDPRRERPQAVSQSAAVAARLKGGERSEVGLTIPQAMLAGGVGRMVGQTVMYPADALRTLSQTRAGAKGLSELGSKVLIRGAVTTSLFAIPLGAIQFSIFGRAKKALRERVDQGGDHVNAWNGLADLGASAMCSVASLSVGVPQEVIKQRLVTGIYPSFRVGVATLWRTEGIRGFYTGFVPTAARNMPFVCMTFTAFSTLQSRAQERSGGLPLSNSENLLYGVSSALVACVFTHPIDVVKTRMMTQSATKLIPYANPADCVRSMLTSEGPKAFFSGIRPRVIYMGPLWAIQFLVNGRLTAEFLDHNSRQRQQGL